MLQRLDLEDCPLEEVPRLDGLIALTTLHIKFTKLVGEPPILSKLLALKDIDISEWKGPICTSIQNLQKLEMLSLRDCRGEYVVPDLESLKRLRRVFLCNCDFKDLSRLGNSMALESLEVVRRDMLGWLPEFEKLTKLSCLSIWNSKRLRNWPRASHLCLLKELAVDKSSMWKFMPILETLIGLQRLSLHAERFENVLSIASLSQFKSLEI